MNVVIAAKRLLTITSLVQYIQPITANDIILNNNQGMVVHVQIHI